MLADPQSVTIDGVASSLPRTGSSTDAGVFTSADGNLTLTISHVRGKRNRRTIRLDHRKVAADPLNTAQNLQYSMSLYMVLNVPSVGYSPDEVKDVLDGFLANLQASSGANEVKFIGGES